jgi:hypothetical protein
MSGTREIYTRTMAATDVITVAGTEGISTLSILCKTDDTGAAGITILGGGRIGGVPANAITLLADESLTVTAASGMDIASLTITAGASSTGIVTGG